MKLVHTSKEESIKELIGELVQQRERIRKAFSDENDNSSQSTD
jgi:hypothetical protein